MKLSQAAMEVLSIIAYNQPLSRSDLDYQLVVSIQMVQLRH